MVNLQIPLLFDISAGGIVFGEDVSGTDLFDAHLNFNLIGSKGALLRQQFENIMYADASENDISGALFFGKTNNLSSTMSAQISDTILSGTGTLVQPNTSTADASNNTSHGARYMAPGIPLPNYSATTSGGLASAVSGTQDYYTAGLCDAAGTSFGRILIRLMATHLMGHPFAQAFIANEQTIINDISNNDVQSQIQDKLFNNDLSMNVATSTNRLAQAVDSGSGRYSALKSDGIRNQILQSIYEALLGNAPERFDLSGNDDVDVSANDISGGTDADMGNLDPSYCRPRVLPFRANDTVSFYFRPRVRLNIDTAIGGSGASYGNDDISGVGQGATNTASSDIKNMFFQPRHRWIAHASTTGPKELDGSAIDSPFDGFTPAQRQVADFYYDNQNSGNRAILMNGTDLVLGENAGETGNGTVFDGHTWKITLTF